MDFGIAKSGFSIEFYIKVRREIPISISPGARPNSN